MISLDTFIFEKRRLRREDVREVLDCTVGYWRVWVRIRNFDLGFNVFILGSFISVIF